MSVASKNPFDALLQDSSSPPSPKAEPVAIPAAAASTRGAQRGRAGPASRGGKYYPRGGRGGAAGRSSDTPEEAAPSGDRPRDDRRREGGDRAGGDRGGRSRGRGGRGRGDRGERGGRGRQFDRHSATGITDSEKKVQQSWGGGDGNAEFNFETSGTNDAFAESTLQVASNDWGAPDAAPAGDDDPWGGAPATTTDGWGGAPATTTDGWGGAPAGTGGDDKPSGDPASPGKDEGAGEGRRRRRDDDEDPNTITLDQYRAQLKTTETVVPKIDSTRKANEGVDEELWKDAVPLKKAEEDSNYFVGKTKAAPKARPKKEEKVYIEIDGRFEAPRRGRGRGGDRGGGEGRGGFGRGRGRGGGGGDRNGSGRPDYGRPASTRQVDVDDTSAFPSLS